MVAGGGIEGGANGRLIASIKRLKNLRVGRQEACPHATASLNNRPFARLKTASALWRGVFRVCERGILGLGGCRGGDTLRLTRGVDV